MTGFPNISRYGLVVLGFVGYWIITGCSSSAEQYVEVDRDHLYEYLYSPFSNSDQLGDLHKELDLLGESLVRDCMAEQGFEYIPFVSGDLSSTESLSDEEFIEIYGFGYSTTLFQSDDSSLAPLNDSSLAPLNDDPNLAILASFSIPEREAYHNAMYGDSGSKENIDGCQAARFEASIPRLAVFEEFYSGFADANERAKADPRMLKLIRGWSECMGTAGFHFNDRDDMLDDLSQRVLPFDDMLDSHWEELNRLMEAAPNGDITALPADTQRALHTLPAVPEEHRGSLETLIDYELLLAKTDFDCDYFDSADKIYDEYNQRFVEANALAILEFLAN